MQPPMGKRGLALRRARDREKRARALPKGRALGKRSVRAGSVILCVVEGTERRRSRARERVAVWALVVLIVLVSLVILFPVFARPRQGHGRSVLTLVKQQGLAVAMYATDHDDRLPLAATWMDALDPYVKNWGVFIDHTIRPRKGTEFGFAFFEPVSSLDSRGFEWPETVPLTFQSKDVSRNAHGLLDLLPYRANGGNYVSFVDSHAAHMPKEWPVGPVTIVLREGTEGGDE